MSGGISAGTIFTAVAGAVASAVVTSALTKRPSGSSAPSIQAPASLQATKAPDEQGRRASQAAARAAIGGAAGTPSVNPLTPSSDALGANKLLGQ